MGKALADLGFSAISDVFNKTGSVFPLVLKAFNDKGVIGSSLTRLTIIRSRSVILPLPRDHR